VGLLLIFIVGGILLATLSLMTPYLENLAGYPVATAGLVLAPRGVGTMAAMAVVGRLLDRVSPRFLIAVGFGVTAFALYEMTSFTPDVSQVLLIRTGLIQGLGIGLVFVPLSTVTFENLPPKSRTQGTALFSLMRNLGSSIGISLMTVILTRNTITAHANLTEHVTLYSRALQLYSPLLDLQSPSGRAAVDNLVTRQAAAVAYIDNFHLMMLVALAAIPLVLLLNSASKTNPHVVVKP
jgi:DHA2 family multidrug resistance protein